MSESMERARALRADPSVHYNCFQATLLPFSERCGIDGETAFRAGTFFGMGMRCGATCGAVTGALMALGLAGAGDGASRALMEAFRAKNGSLECAELLRKARENGENRKCHCDRMVFDAVEMTEALLEK